MKTSTLDLRAARLAERAGRREYLRTLQSAAADYKLNI